MDKITMHIKRSEQRKIITMRKLFAVTFLLLLALPSIAQYGGTAGYQFINLPNSARNAALGGRIISIMDNDLNLALSMPAMLDSTDHDQVVFNYTGYLSDINYGTVGYAKYIPEVATFAASLQYISYGEIAETDVSGQEIGSLSSGEYMLSLGAGRQLDEAFSVGSNVKVILSNLAEYNASAVALDLSGAYRSKDTFFSAGLLVRNIGFNISNYTENGDLSVPFGIDLGLTRKLAKSPLRFSVNFENLQKWDLTFTDPADLNQVDPLTGQVIELPEESTLEKGMRHVILGSEFILSENFHLRFGYNFRRRAELRLEQKPATSGISWGLGLRISKFKLNYGRATYNQAGSTNHISMTVRLSDFKRG
ncbi:MAG: hypothetical protein ACI8XB_000388 [Patiriisocius sp.]|jgi:hypothetical protein